MAGKCTAEDCTYIRDLIERLEGNEQFLFIHIPLAFYRPRKMKAAGQVWGGWLNQEKKPRRVKYNG